MSDSKSARKQKLMAIANALPEVVTREQNEHMGFAVLLLDLSRVTQ